MVVLYQFKIKSQLSQKALISLNFLGHLAAKADFVYAVQQVATFQYINAAPKFQSINGGNWVKLENAVRKLAISSNEKLRIFTGTLNILSVKDANNKKQEIFLKANQPKGVQVPLYLYKVIQGSDRDVVIFGEEFLVIKAKKLNSIFKIIFSALI